MSYLPTVPKAIRYGGRELRILFGIGWGLSITTEDDATSPIHLTQLQEAKERKVRELF